MAFGSGSSLASDCCTRRGDSPSSLQRGASRAGQSGSTTSRPRSPPPTAGRSPPGASAGRGALFSRVLGVGADNPALGAQPAHPHPLQSSSHGLRAHSPLGNPLLEAHLGGQLQRPQARVLAELPGTSMKHLAQPLGPPLLEASVYPLGSRRALAQRFSEAPLVEALHGAARRLGIAAQRAGNLVGVL